MYGKPKYQKGDIVKFDIISLNSDESIECEGWVYVVDKYGIFGYNDDVYYDVKLNDNKFEVAFAKVNNKADMLKMLVLINTIDLKDIPGITYYQTDNLKVEFLDSPKSSWCIDGEEFEGLNNVYEVDLKNGVEMLIPNKNIEKLFLN